MKIEGKEYRAVQGSGDNRWVLEYRNRDPFEEIYWLPVIGWLLWLVLYPHPRIWWPAYHGIFRSADEALCAARDAHKPYEPKGAVY